MADNIPNVHEKVVFWKQHHCDSSDTDRETDKDTEEETEVFSEKASGRSRKLKSSTSSTSTISTTPTQRKQWQKNLSLRQLIFNLKKFDASGILKPTEDCFSRILYVEDQSSEARENFYIVRGKSIILDYIYAKKDVALQNFFDDAMLWAQEKHKLPAVSGDAFALTGFQLFCATNISAIMNKEKLRPKDKTIFEIQDVTKAVLCFLRDAAQRSTGNMHLIRSLREGLCSSSRADNLKSDYSMLFETLPGGRYKADPMTQLLHVYKYCCRHSGHCCGIAKAILCIIRAFKMERWDEGTLEYFLTNLLNAEGLTCMKATSIVIKQVKSGPEDSACQMVKPDILYFGMGKEGSDDALAEKEEEDVCNALLKLVLDDSKTVCICFPMEVKSDTMSYHQVILKPCEGYVYADPAVAFEYSESTEAEHAISSHLGAGGDTKTDLFLKLRVDHLWQTIIQMYAVMMNSNTFNISEKTTKILQGGILTINKESLVLVLVMDKNVYLALQKSTSAAKTFNSLAGSHTPMGRIFILSDVFSSIDILELSAYCHYHLCDAFDGL